MSSKDLVVCKNFKLVKKLGTGAFGQIYLAQNRTNPNEKYAAKLQDASTKFPQLYFEAKIYKYLTSSGNVTGIPKVYAMTTQGKYNVMLMDLLGKSLQDLFVDYNKKFTLKTTLMLVQQMIDRIQYLHEKQIIHRDIKPDNFLMGIGNKNHLVYVVDLGLSKKYIKDNKHIPYKQGKQLTGTARYASINTHMGIQQSRRDDIQAIGYVMMYFLRGILPWQNMKAKDTKTKYNMILEKKMSTPAEVLCKGFPPELATFINYAKGLKFQQKPDYSYLKSLLNSAKKNNKIQTDYVYDWSHQIQNKPVNLNQSLNKPQNHIDDSLNTLNKIQGPLQQKIPIGTSNNLDKKYMPPTNSNNNTSMNNKYSSSVNKNTNVLSNTGNKILQPTMIGSKNDLKSSIQNTDNMRNTKSKMKNTTYTSGINEFQALGSKITGPKISVIKR